MDVMNTIVDFATNTVKLNGKRFCIFIEENKKKWCLSPLKSAMKHIYWLLITF